jgi:hypothetical protein
MKRKADMTVEEALAKEEGALSQRALKFTMLMRDIVASAKNNPAFGPHSWEPLAEVVDTDNYDRIGIWKEHVKSWSEYTKLLCDWARLSDWEPRVRRISEQAGYVFQELTEFGEYKQQNMKDEIFSLTVFEFNEQNKIVHMDVYMQREQVTVPKGTWEV